MRGLLLCLLSATLAAADGGFTVRSAVFSSEQAFWPGLAPQGASTQGKPQKPRKADKPAKAGAGKVGGANAGAAGKGAALRLVVLPIRIAAGDWKESIPCDSCHRLSPNGMEFFLENYLAERLRRRFPGQEVELAAPHDPLLQAGHMRLLEYQDSLRLPWDRWFDGYDQALIFRTRDRMISAEDVRRLDKLGGRLGATHLLLPAKVWMKIEPVASNTHSGDMEWGFHLLFWNVAEGRAEWVMALSEQAPRVDLDAALDDRLDKALVAAWDRMPADLAALWKAEPQ